MQNATQHHKRRIPESPAVRSPARPESVTGEPRQSLAIRLTPKEKLIISLIRQGYSNSDICRGLRLSDNTIRWHMKNIYKKTGAADRSALSRMYFQTPE